MNFAEKELVEQPFPVFRVLSHQIACSFRDPGETRGLLAKWRPGLWNNQGTRLRGMGPVNLSMAAVGPERACPCLCIANAGDSCTTVCYRCQLVTHPSSEKRSKPMICVVQPALRHVSRGHRSLASTQRVPDIGGENLIDELGRHPGHRAPQGKAELLVPISSSTSSHIMQNLTVQVPTQE
jgi:hypothetical protein